MSPLSVENIPIQKALRETIGHLARQEAWVLKVGHHPLRPSRVGPWAGMK